MNPMLLSLVPTLALCPAPPGDLLAVRVGRAETVSHGTIEHAVIVVEDGKIVKVGEDLLLERGIPVLDRPEWVATPGLVNCYSRAGLDSTAGKVDEPQAQASKELDPQAEIWREVLEAGVTTLGIYPPGTGMPGLAVAVRPHGETRAEMIVAEPAYLKIFFESEARSKKDLRDAFAKLEEYDEKVAKAREKWEKDQEKKSAKKPAAKKADDKKEEEKKEEGEKEKKEGDGPLDTSALARQQEEGKKEEPKDEKKEAADEFVPPEPDPKVVPFLKLRDKTLKALFRITKAGDYLHLLDVIEERDFDWCLRVPLRNDIDLYEIKDKLGEKERLVVLDPLITLQPNTRRERNVPAELDRAGARVALIPRRDDARGHELWMQHVAEIVARGMDPQSALAAVTLEPARVLGLDARLGSLEAGKDANLVFWSGDPLQPGSEVRAVMLEGEFVHGPHDGQGAEEAVR
jgi:hypothetical protein